MVVTVIENVVLSQHHHDIDIFVGNNDIFHFILIFIHVW